jgi:hypothetical protein
MYLSGTLNFKGPGLKKEEFCVKDKSGAEFNLELSEGPKPEIQDFDVWIQMADDKEISIKTDASDGEIIDQLYLTIEGKDGGCLAISVSPNQAAAIAEVLWKFKDVHVKYNELCKPVKVSTQERRV